MPDRLPSLIVLAGFWVPPAIAGWMAAGSLERRTVRDRPTVTYVALSVFVLCHAVAWYFFNLHRMPPYIPGSTMDPTYASPGAARALAIFTSAVILPGSAVACAAAVWWRRRVSGSGSANLSDRPEKLFP